MARNAERDKLEADQRKAQLVQAGFELFSRDGIEQVSLSAVAKKAGVPASTMYKYFQNKVNLAVTISGWVWSGVWDEALAQAGVAGLAQMNPRQLFETYADVIVALYRNRPEVLRYSASYKTFIRREDALDSDLKEHLDPLQPMAELFFNSCAQATRQGLVRCDVSPEKMYSFVALTMLTMAERYALGVVWTETPGADHVDDLLNLKGMLSAWISGE